MAMADEKGIFTATDSSYLSSTNIRQERKSIFEKIIAEKSPQGFSDAISELIKQLFPQMEGLYTNHYYGHEQQRYWRQQLYVRSEDIFDKYFLLSVPSSTLSEKSLKDILATINDKPAFTENLKTFEEENKLRLVLDRLQDYLDSLIDQQKENLVIGVFDFSEGVKDRKYGIADLQDVDTQTIRLGYQTLKRVAKRERVAFLTKILTSTKNLF